MAGMQFEYDEKGGTFYYFLLSFMALVLIPATYYLWPSNKRKEDPEKLKKVCRCDPCRIKEQRLKEREPWRNFKRRSIKVGLIVGWILMILVAYKASLVEIDMTEFDPYGLLGLDKGASVKEIKKAYRQLSLIHHPDRGGDEKHFLLITKAHQALTDDEARKNWEEYGNPDGPGATHFGIALPKWIVEKQNSVWVLAVYGLVFMIILPSVVGAWWYRSIKFSSEQILMDTMNMYTYFLQKTPNMMVKRVIPILGSSFEFDKRHCSEVVERPSDNVELPRLMRDLPHLKRENKTRPFCLPYSMKGQCLLHAHFMRLELPHKTLEQDRLFVIQKCPYLINEMVKILAQLVTFAKTGRCQMPRLETVENCMRVSQMVVQGLWENKSPLLQMPHITEDMLRHFVTRKRNIRTIRDFACLKDADRRMLLRSLGDEDYQDVVNVCSQMPYIDMEVKSEVLDDEDSTIAAGDIVTVFVKLTRHPMESKFSMEDLTRSSESAVCEEEAPEEVEEIGQGDGKVQNTVDSPKKPKAWELNKKKKGKGGKAKKKPAKPVFIKRATPKAAPAKKEEDSPQPNGLKWQVAKVKSEDVSDDDADAESRDDGESDQEEGASEPADDETEEVGDDDEWLRLQEESRKDNMLDSKSKETHIVHCPYFPGKKYEWWWLYVADRKSHMLITAPLQVCSLKTQAELQLKFCAPSKPGSYQYTVILKSDSYVEFDVQHNIKVDVKEAKKVENHPQWNLSEDEEEKEDEEASESDASTDYAYSDEED